MAEEFDQNRTEEPTPRRRERAREEGDVLVSPDLTASVSLVFLAFFLQLFGAWWIRSLANSIAVPLTQLRRMDWDVSATVVAGQWFLSRACLAGGVVSGLVVVVAISTILVQSGFSFTVKPLTPNWERLSPAGNWNKLLSVESLSRSGIALLKVVSVMLVAGMHLAKNTNLIRHIGHLGQVQAFATIGSLLLGLMLRLGGIALVWGVVDFSIRRWRRELKLKMSKQEIKDEHKDDQGDPQIRARMRRVQLESAQRRALTEVPSATLVITNPTHFAVALKYESGRMNAPVVVAKGKDLFARRIARIARENGVPVLERKPLTRAIYALADVGDEIPAEFYRAIAELLAHVYRLKNQSSTPPPTSTNRV